MKRADPGSLFLKLIFSVMIFFVIVSVVQTYAVWIFGGLFILGVGTGAKWFINRNTRRDERSYF